MTPIAWMLIIIGVFAVIGLVYHLFGFDKPKEDK